MTTTTHTQLEKSVQGFYELTCKMQLISFQTKYVNIPDWGQQAYRLYRGDYQGFSFPVVHKHSQGEKLRDVLEDSNRQPALISERCKQVLLDYKLTGWQTYPILLHDYDGTLLPGYHGFSVLGRCGPIDRGASTIFQKRLVPTGPLVDICKGVFPDMTQWDGSDFFVPTNSGHFFISSKAYKALKKEKISNLCMKNFPDIQNIKTDWLGGTKWSPGGKPWWNPPVKPKG